MRVVLCAIARLENPYVKEWIDYHLGIGFSHIFIYDNSRNGEEPISTVINVDSYNYKGRITIKPFHEVEVCPQLMAYNDCYKNESFDWIAFLDLDEFFTLNSKAGYKNVEDFVNSICGFDAILLNWMVYGDCGNLHYEEKPIVERFKIPLPVNYSVHNLFGKQPINGHIKTMIRGGLDIKMSSPHIGEGEYKCCNAEGHEIQNRAYQEEINHNVAYVRHYITKSIEEYIETKGKRPAADSAFPKYSITSFFWYNKPTWCKINQYKHYCKTHHIDDRRSMAWWIKCYIKMWIITPLLLKK